MAKKTIDLDVKALSVVLFHPTLDEYHEYPLRPLSAEIAAVAAVVRERAGNGIGRDSGATVSVACAHDARRAGVREFRWCMCSVACLRMRVLERARVLTCNIICCCRNACATRVTPVSLGWMMHEMNTRTPRTRCRCRRWWRACPDEFSHIA